MYTKQKLKKQVFHNSENLLKKPNKNLKKKKSTA